MIPTVPPVVPRRCADRRSLLPVSLLPVSLLPALVLLVACSDPAPSAVAPPAPATTSAGATSTPESDPAPVPTTVEVADGADPAVTALRTYLREQARAVNAGTADPGAVPDFTATLTAPAREWALPLLAANLGDRMPGPYPVGVLGTDRPADDLTVLSICLQDRGWQVDAATGRPRNAERFGTATATVRRVGDGWLVDDVAADGGSCAAGDVVREVF